MNGCPSCGNQEFHIKDKKRFGWGRGCLLGCLFWPLIFLGFTKPSKSVKVCLNCGKEYGFGQAQKPIDPKVRIISLIVIFGLFFILYRACTGNNSNKQAKIFNNENSFWTENQMNKFLNSNTATDFERFIVTEYIEENITEKDEEFVKEFMKTKGFEDFKNENISSFEINVQSIAGKTGQEVIGVLGEPNKSEVINPWNTPCPCDKKFYLNNHIEIVYIDNKSDWITIDNTFKQMTGLNEAKYQSVDKFDDYTYVKVKTK